MLNPGAYLPLHIFEMRYRNLFSKAWDGNKKVCAPPTILALNKHAGKPLTLAPLLPPSFHPPAHMQPC